MSTTTYGLSEAFDNLTLNIDNQCDICLSKSCTIKLNYRMCTSCFNNYKSFMSYSNCVTCGILFELNDVDVSMKETYNVQDFECYKCIVRYE